MKTRNKHSRFTLFAVALCTVLAFHLTGKAQLPQCESDVLWKKNFGGKVLDQYKAVTVVSDGFVAVGYAEANSFNNGDWEGISGKSNEDAIIVKYNKSGVVVWKKNFGGSGIDRYYSVTAVSDSIIAVGYSASGSFTNGDWTGVPGSGNNEAIIVKYDHNGDVVWKKKFGGSAADFYNSVIAVSDGIIAVGSSASFTNGDWAGAVTGKGGTDAIIVKYDNSGNLVWKKNFGGSGEDYYKFVTAVPDGIVAVGYSSAFDGDWAGLTGNGSNDAIIVKYDNNGNVVWKKNFGGSSGDQYYSVTTVSDGVVAVGYSQSASFETGDWAGVAGQGNDDGIIVKYDNNGNVVWKKHFGGNSIDQYNAVTAVSGGVIAVGSSEAFGNGDWAGVAGQGSYDAIIVKYDNNGDIVWKDKFGGNSQDIYNSVAALSNGIVAVGYSVGTSFGTGDWAGFTGNGGADATIVRYGCPVVEPEECTPKHRITNMQSPDYSENGIIGTPCDNIKYDPENETLRAWVIYELNCGKINIKLHEDSKHLLDTTITVANNVTTKDNDDCGDTIRIDLSDKLTKSSPANIKFTFDLEGITCISGGQGIAANGDKPATKGEAPISPLIYDYGVEVTSVLPISLLNFNAACRNGQVALNWTTATETNNDYFTIERGESSGNSKSIRWTKIADIKGAGNSSTPLSYAYADHFPFEGGKSDVIYYRLKQTDYNGTYKQYNPIVVNCKDTEHKISIYPNPVNHTLYFSAETSFEITDLQGKVLLKEDAPVKFVDVSRLQAGIYFLKAAGETVKVVKN